MSACVRCGGTKDLMDRGMAPGMTYCAPCRRAMSGDVTARNPRETQRPRQPAHDLADELLELIGDDAGWEVAAWIRRARAEQRLHLDDYLYDVLRGEVFHV